MERLRAVAGQLNIDLAAIKKSVSDSLTEKFNAARDKAKGKKQASAPPAAQKAEPPKPKTPAAKVATPVKKAKAKSKFAPAKKAAKPAPKPKKKGKK
jgi:hypothetical protein